MIEPYVSAVSIIEKRNVRFEVVLETQGVWRRQIGENRGRHRRYTSAGDHIVGKWRPVRAVRQARRRIVQHQSGNRAEIAGPHGSGGNSGDRRDLRVIQISLEIGEAKRTVLHDRATNTRAGL